MRSLLPLFACFSLALLGSSCVRSDMNVSVQKDGSGTITVDQRISPQTMAMLKQLESFGDSLGKQLSAAGGSSGSSLDSMRSIVNPNVETLKMDATRFGEGVRYEKHAVGKDADGWAGHQVVYAFDDVRKLRLDASALPGAGSRDQGDSKAGDVSFDLAGDVLTISSRVSEREIESMLKGQGLDSAKSMGMSPTAALQMAAQSMDGMRFGFHIEAANGLASTDADHVSGNKVTLIDADVAKVLKDPKFVSFVEKASKNPDAVDSKEARELAQSLDGFTLESKEVVTMTLK